MTSFYFFDDDVILTAQAIFGRAGNLVRVFTFTFTFTVPEPANPYL